MSQWSVEQKILYGECLRKRPMTELKANRVIKQAQKRYQLHLRKYKCPHCKQFHLTREKIYK